MTTYFHAHGRCADPGQIIRPGHYGKMIAVAGAAHWEYPRERVLEVVRAREFPRLPSRLACCFACPSEADARAYRRASRGRRPSHVEDFLYEVELVDARATRHSGDWRLAERVLDDPGGEATARQYWQGNRLRDDPGDPDGHGLEVVLSSALRLLRRLD